MTKTRVVFLGSGPVALDSLTLLAPHLELEAIITKTTTRAQMQAAFPETQVFNVDSRKDLEELIAKQRFESSIGLLIDFGIIVSQEVIDYFPKGIVNSHFSLLPEWRGADPITYAILSGQEQTGVSLMLLVEQLDAGPLLAQEPLHIAPNLTTLDLTRALIQLSVKMLAKALPAYMNNKLLPRDQLEATILHGIAPTYSRKLTKTDGHIEWIKPAAVIEREIRAYITWPHSYTTLGSVSVILTAASVTNEPSNAPGTIEVRQKKLLIDCSDYKLDVLMLKPAGKQEMSAQAFLAGYANRIL